MSPRILTTATVASLCALVGALTFTAAPALAARGHVPGKTLAAPCANEPCAPGTLKEPAGVAVNEATGDIYVVDKASGLVTEFEKEGTVVTSFGNNGAGGTPNGQLTGPTGEGEGLVMGGSTTIEFATPTNGSAPFAVGEVIEGEGIEPNTEIINIPIEGTLEISQAIKVGQAAEMVTLKAHQHFAAPESIAIDNSCFLHKTPAEEAACAALDPSAGDVYVADIGHGAVDKFSSTGAYLGQLTGFGQINGVAVDPRGELWIGTVGGAASFTDAQTNEPIGSPAAGYPGDFNTLGFTVDSEDNLYLHDESGQLFETLPGGCPSTGGGGIPTCSDNKGLLDEQVDKNPITGVAGEAAGNDIYVDHGESLDRRAPDGSLLETLGSAPGPGKLTAGTGVGVDSSTETVYIAEAATGEVFEYAGEPPNAPVVTGEAASKVTGESATLEAEVNPRGEPDSSETPTSYSFQYITQAAYQHDVALGQAPFAECGTPADPGCLLAAGATLAPDFEAHTVTPVNVQELAPATTYRFRVLATNHHGMTEGERNGAGEEVVHTFTTQAAGEFVLPDGRQWEMVSPPNKHGALIEPLGKEFAVQASAAGGAMAYGTQSPTESEPQGYSLDVQVFSMRGASGWSSQDLTLPHEVASGLPNGEGSEVERFSEDLSQALVQPQGAFVACTSAEGAAQHCLSEAASEQTAFLRDDATGLYTPLVTGCPAAPLPCAPAVSEHANVPAGTVFGTPEGGDRSGPQFVGATSDLGHVVLESKAALTSPPAGDLYEWSAGKGPGEQLAPVSILPPSEGGEPTGGSLGRNGEDTRHAISNDGSRVFWQTGSIENEPLYMRDLAKKPGAETLRITSGEGEFQDAAADGSSVLYTEGTGHVIGPLFECRIEEEAGKLKCASTELAPSILGTILGASEDGSWVYFVSSAAKPSTLQGPEGVAGSPNLYVYHGRTSRLIAVLSSADFDDWDEASGNLAHLTGRVSPDGHWLAFMSEQRLTGYDNRDVASGRPDEEVYLYHAPESLESGSHPPGTLTCASCNPSGARPIGEEGKKTDAIHGGLVGGEAWESSSTSLAASVPAWDLYGVKKSVYQPRYLSDSGRLFFDARDSLVPQAVNENWDVYEYEPENVPAASSSVCSPASTSGSEAFEPARTFEVAGRKGEAGAGCVALISSGESDQESAFLDASEGGGEGEQGTPGTPGGGDVFFMTTAQLSKQDTDNAYDVYDAHECTSESPCSPAAAAEPPECKNEASCKPAPEPQPGAFGLPASATFSGPGNSAAVTPAVVVKPKSLTRAQKLANALKSCKKDKKKAKRKACERAAHKQFGAAKKAKRSSNDRRAK